jgi:diamine N-acetyltransferase
MRRSEKASTFELELHSTPKHDSTHESGSRKIGRYGSFNRAKKQGLKLVLEMPEGKNVRLKLADKEDMDFFVDFWNNIDYYGDYEPIMEQTTRAEAEKRFEDTSKSAMFIIQKKDGTNIGLIVSFGESSGSITIGYAIKPNEQGKGYGTEAVQLMTDYLFLTKMIHRVQANTDPDNKVSQRILEKVGFKKEGVSRKSSFVRGEWRDEYRYGILREEWIEPRILTKTA